MRILGDWAAKYPKTCQLLTTDLPNVAGRDAALWNAFSGIMGMQPEALLSAVGANQQAPLLWFLHLGVDTGGQFNDDVPGRISLSAEVAVQFEQNSDNPIAQQYMRLTALHEMCHWAWHLQNKPDPDIAGEEFEKVAGVHPDPSWMKDAFTGPALLTAASQPQASTLADQRAKALQDALTAGANVPPSADLFDGSDVARGMSRGIRNNNPGNIRVGDNWLGLSERSRMTDFQQQESDFCVFSEPEWGLRAMALIFRKYQAVHGLKTPLEIIARWAPAADNNDVHSYATAVASALNVQTTSSIDLTSGNPTSNNTLVDLMKAVARHENSQKIPYNDLQYQIALKLL